MNHKLLALYGLKFNPFSPELPVGAIYVPQKIENFCWRIEHAQIREGGFAMVHGDPGSGKSIVLRLLAERLKKLPDVTVGPSISRRAIWQTFTVSSVTSSVWRCARATGGVVASRLCVSAGSATWSPADAVWCCRSMRRRK